METLKGSRALVTGASSGIGEAYARDLARRGADLVLAARRIDRLHALAEALSGESGISVECFQADLSLPGAARELFDQATRGARPVHLLVNNAGLGPYGDFLRAPLQGHASTIAVNVVALTELSHLFASQMLGLDDRRCYIQNVASVTGFQGVAKFAVYSASKFYVRVFSEILARELRGTRVWVSCVCPGGTRTEFLEHNNQVLKGSGRGTMMSAEAVASAGVEGMLAGKRIIIPGLLNKMACFLPRFFPRNWALAIAEGALDRAVGRGRIRGPVAGMKGKLGLLLFKKLDPEDLGERPDVA